MVIPKTCDGKEFKSMKGYNKSFSNNSGEMMPESEIEGSSTNLSLRPIVIMVNKEVQ